MIPEDPKPSAWIGIDPGQTGAAALISESGEIDVADWPGDPSAAASIIREWSECYEIRFGFLERVNAMPKQGVVSTFNFGANFGRWDGILSALGVPYRLIQPREWQTGLVRKSDGKNPKARSLAVARRLFPAAPLNLAKHHNRADALLLAHRAKEAA